MDNLSTLLPGGAATIKQHSVNSDGQTITMRSPSELRDLASLEVEQSLSCDQKNLVMKNLMRFGSVRQKYDR